MKTLLYNVSMLGLIKFYNVRLIGFALVVVLTGCSALSRPHASDRISGLLQMPSNQKVQSQRMYSAHHYVDGQTPAKELAALYDQTSLQLANEAD